VRTDAEGRWSISNVPNHPGVELDLLLSHPDFTSDEVWRQTRRSTSDMMKSLRQQAAVLTLKRGIVVTGRITDPAGQPIQNAIIVNGDNPYDRELSSKFVTDANGCFRLPALPPRETTLTAIAPDLAPQLRKINLQAGLSPIEFHMQQGKLVRLRIVDAAGKPVPEAYVSIIEWKGSKSLQSMHNPNHPKMPDTKIPSRADADGVWAWSAAPDDPVKLEISANGYSSCELEVAGGTPERVVKLKVEHRITGRVTDAVTGRAIPAFAVIPVDVFGPNFLSAERMNAVTGKNGRLDYLAHRADIPLRIRVEAEGYRIETGPEFRVGDDSPHTQDFRLQPSPSISGVVLDTAGQPANMAEVILATPTEVGRLAETDSNHRVLTDSSGHFAFPDAGEPHAIIARSDRGFALAEFPASNHQAVELQLKPWASVRGQFRDGGKPIAGATVILNLIRLGSLDQPQVYGMLQMVTDADGRFEFPRVPPFPSSVRVLIGPWKDDGFRAGPSIPLGLQPGQRAEVNLGGAGAIVTGRVRLTGKVPADLDCTYSLNYLVQREPGLAPPSAIAAAGFDARQGWRDSWQQTQEGLTFLSTLRHWFVKLAPDGTLSISGVPVGDYDLAVALYAKPAGCLVEPLARQVVRVSVTEADVARGRLEIPEISAMVVPVPAVGDFPELSFGRSDGTRAKLADFRGRHTVVHFWASWCGPCKRQLPALKRVQERFAASGLTVVSLSLDENEAAWQQAVRALALPWQQGRFAGVDAGISSVPAYWLLDPAGKIVAKVYEPEELVRHLSRR
jgi:thiol-disulfide isomerase/thioredoxin/uncharacterized GH25 family protein